jgi:hypothetical protein
MPDERDTLRRGVGWTRGIADAVRRALGRCDQDLEIDLGAGFEVGPFGSPMLCGGVNSVGRICFPPPTVESGDIVRIRDLVAALALLDEIAGLVQRGLEPPPDMPEIVTGIVNRLPVPR